MLKISLLTAALIGVAPVAALAADSGAVAGSINVKVTAGNHVMTATFENNNTSRALVAQFPLTIPMQNLYNREMCYRFADPLPANEVRTSGYEVGDIVYWAPRHSFVIMYEQNDERISNLQKVGHIDSGVEVFKHMSNINVTFELQ